MSKQTSSKGAPGKPAPKSSAQGSKPQSGKGPTPAKSTPPKSSQPVKKGQPAPKPKTKKFSWRTWLWPVIGVVTILGLALFVMWQNQDTQQSSSPAKEISVDEASKMRDQGAFILDVRQPEEWNEVHIPDATLIPLGELPARINEVPKDQDVVVVCRSGNRSQEGRDILLDAGYEQVTSMAGGMNEWTAAGYPTVSGP